MKTQKPVEQCEYAIRETEATNIVDTVTAFVERARLNECNRDISTTDCCEELRSKSRCLNHSSIGHPPSDKPKVELRNLSEAGAGVRTPFAARKKPGGAPSVVD
jgi:hypothetical protein